MKCPTCGSEKKHHTPDLWTEHQRMHKAYMKIRKSLERDVKKRRLSTKPAIVDYKY